MKILSLNILCRDTPAVPVRGKDGCLTDATVANRSVGILKLLAAEKPDVFGVQEFSRPWSAWLETHEFPGYGKAGGATDHTAEGCYIFYRKEKLELLRDGSFWLAEGAPSVAAVGWDAKYDRICSYAFLKSRKNGSVFLMLNTHFDHVGEEARTNSAKLVLSELPKLRRIAEEHYHVAHCPAVLVGDLNALPSSDAYRILAGELADARFASAGKTVSDEYCTFSGFHWCDSPADYVKNNYIIDYIFTDRETCVKEFGMVAASTNLCPYGPFVTDHNVIWADLEF